MLNHFLALIISLLLMAGCRSSDKRKAELPDTPEKGTITISADLSFKPVIDEQVMVYESNNPGTKINVQYKPEAECIKDLWNDSIRMIISTFSLSNAEKKGIADSLNVTVSQLAIARDAIAVIVNPASPDSLFDMNDIRKILGGTYERALTPVFEGVKATSTVRYIIDSVMKGKPLSNKVIAAQTSDSVINYVARNPGAIGFVGVSWIGNPDDKEQLSFLKKVKIARLKSNDNAEKYILPVQANLYDNRYPMTRDLVYILKERYRGLGWGFSYFLAEEIGQLIFKRSYLMPGRRLFIMRPAAVKDEPI